MSIWTRIHRGHERLKRAVHEGMRVPLPRWGQRTMAFVYFCTPIVGGYYVMQWAISRAHESIGPDGERLPDRYRKNATTTNNDDDDDDNDNIDKSTETDAQATSSSAYYGVPLATSDPESQRKSKERLQRYLRQQLKQQQQKQQQQQQQ